MEKFAIIEKLKKLLRMKRGGTPDEVATALRMAQELAAKHGIDLRGVNPDEECQEKPISHSDHIVGTRVQFECQYAALVAQNFFNVSVFKTARRDVGKYALRFVGTAWDTQIAIYVYHFLVGHFRREWNTRHGRFRNRRSFMWGMYLGLSQKLRARQPAADPQPGIVAVDRQLQRRRDYIAAHFGELESQSAAPGNAAAAARYAGYLAGQRTEIRSGVPGNASASQLANTTRQLGFDLA